MTLLETMKAEREKLIQARDAHKADPKIAARVTELKAELGTLTAQISGADIKAKIAAVDRAIKSIENPGRVTRPMSEEGKARIKAGLANYHAKRKAAAQGTALATSPVTQTVAPVAPAPKGKKATTQSEKK
jgi:hypothetical protein